MGIRGFTTDEGCCQVEKSHNAWYRSQISRWMFRKLLGHLIYSEISGICTLSPSTCIIAPEN